MKMIFDNCFSNNHNDKIFFSKNSKNSFRQNSIQCMLKFFKFFRSNWNRANTIVATTNWLYRNIYAIFLFRWLINFFLKHKSIDFFFKCWIRFVRKIVFRCLICRFIFVRAKTFFIFLNEFFLWWKFFASLFYSRFINCDDVKLLFNDERCIFRVFKKRI